MLKTNKKNGKILRVGFDLDGVLLYNPTRILRPVIVFLKKYFLKRNLNKFYYPKTKLEKIIWLFLHKSSVWLAPGTDELAKLIKEKKLEAYIISARYESLKEDFDCWVGKLKAKMPLSGFYNNSKNEQPYLFKEKMIKKLKLDIYVEDNWDIVKHLNKHCKVFWIYNLLDRKIVYKYKFAGLNKVVEYLKSSL